MKVLGCLLENLVGRVSEAWATLCGMGSRVGGTQVLVEVMVPVEAVLVRLAVGITAVYVAIKAGRRWWLMPVEVERMVVVVGVTAIHVVRWCWCWLMWRGWWW